MGGCLCSEKKGEKKEVARRSPEFLATRVLFYFRTTRSELESLPSGISSGLRGLGALVAGKFADERDEAIIF